MTRIYISDAGDDRNDGLTRETAIYSWQRAVKLCDAASETYLMQGGAKLESSGGKMRGRRDRNDRDAAALTSLLVRVSL